VSLRLRGSASCRGSLPCAGCKHPLTACCGRGRCPNGNPNLAGCAKPASGGVKPSANSRCTQTCRTRLRSCRDPQPPARNRTVPISVKRKAGSHLPLPFVLALALALRHGVCAARYAPPFSTTRRLWPPVRSTRPRCSGVDECAFHGGSTAFGRSRIRTPLTAVVAARPLLKVAFACVQTETPRRERCLSVVRAGAPHERAGEARETGHELAEPRWRRVGSRTTEL